MEGLVVFWGGPGTVYKKDYKYSGPGKTYNITAVKGRSEEDDISYNNDKSIKIKLDSSKTYILGMDMSTSQSGLSIFDMNMDLLYMIDIINSNMKADELYRHIRSFLSCNFQGVNFKFTIIEEQIQTKNGRMVFGKLSELQGSILAMSDIFCKAIDRIAPGVWRKHFLKSPVYDGVRQKKNDVKVSAAKEVITRYPKFETYINVMKRFSRSDQMYICDSCDAVGAACGYVAENYGDDKTFTNRIVSHTMKLESNHHVRIKHYRFNPKTMEIIKENPLNSKEMVKTHVSEIFVAERRVRGVMNFIYNNSMKIMENIQRCTANYDEVIFLPVTNPKVNANLQWETGIILEDGEIFLIVAMSENIKDKKKAVVFQPL